MRLYAVFNEPVMPRVLATLGVALLRVRGWGRPLRMRMTHLTHENHARFVTAGARGQTAPLHPPGRFVIFSRLPSPARARRAVAPRRPSPPLASEPSLIILTGLNLEIRPPLCEKSAEKTERLHTERSRSHFTVRGESVTHVKNPATCRHVSNVCNPWKTHHLNN